MISNREKARMTRRSLLRSGAAAAMLGPLFKATEGSVSAQETVNRNSAPSGLKITDMRACRVAANYDYPLIKIYTNQDVYGLGEVRDAGVEGIALVLKAHLLGKNPLDIEGNLATIWPFAGHGRMGGGYSAVDMALHDIAGKVLRRSGVPADRRKEPRPHSHLRGYHRPPGCQDVRGAHAQAQGDGCDLLQDGSGNVPGEGPPRRRQ